MSKRRRYDSVYGDLGGYFRFLITPAEHRARRIEDTKWGSGRQGRRKRQRIQHARVKR